MDKDWEQYKSLVKNIIYCSRHVIDKERNQQSRILLSDKEAEVVGDGLEKIISKCLSNKSLTKYKYQRKVHHP